MFVFLTQMETVVHFQAWLTKLSVCRTDKQDSVSRYMSKNQIMINHYTSYSYNKIRSQCILSVSVRTSYVDVHDYKTDGKGNVENIIFRTI